MNFPVYPLTLSQTCRLWGGLRVRRLDGSVLSCADVTDVAVSLLPDISSNARVANVHVNALGPCLKQLRSGGKARYMRELLDSRAVLEHHGYTHVVLSGPMLQSLNGDKRIVQIKQFKAHALIRGIASLGTWVSFVVARVAVLFWGRGRNRGASGFSLSPAHIWRAFEIVEVRAL